MSFEPELWTRLEYAGMPIYLRPDKPDWFVPNRSGDLVLKRLLSGERPVLGVHEQRFLQRLPDGELRSYPGRHAFLRTDHLRELWFHITDTCDMSCRHCLVSSSPNERDLIPAANLLDVAGQARALGCTVFGLSGGEPFVHREFETIVDGLLGLEGTRVAVLTNGAHFQRYEKALKRWSPGRFHLQVSVDGLRESHDAVRGKGSFDKLSSQLRWLERTRIPFSVSMCVMQENHPEMPAIVDFAAEVGASNVHFLWYFVRGRGTGAGFAEPAEIFKHLKEAARRAGTHGITIDNVEACRTQVFSPSGTVHDGSNGGWESLAVGPDNRLYPSPALVGVAELGTPLNGDLARTWRESAVLEELRRSTAARLASPLKFIVGGGDADHSFVHGGRFVGHDPYLPLYEEIALWLIASEAAGQSADGPPGLRLKMGDVLERCGHSGEVALVHSNCLLAVASGDDVRIVKEFYTKAVRSPREDILNPVCYPEELVAHIPRKCLVRSYGCGSPVLDAGLRRGEAVVDLGSGTGVECLIASKLVGREGSVVGIDMLEPMLELALEGAEATKEKLGYGNVEFKKAYLESLPLDDISTDVILSNCVINLSHHKRRTFTEIFRVLKDGGRLVVSDVVCEDEPPSSIRNDEILRGECIAGALTQRDLVGLLEEAGFVSFRVLKRFPYRVVGGHPFFSMTFEARKATGKQVRRVMYRGPFAAVVTRDGSVLTPGETYSVPVRESIDGSEQIFELDSSGRVTNSDIGGAPCAPCCSVESPSEDAATREPEGCCGAPSIEISVTSPQRGHQRDCMVCGAALEYSIEEREVRCEYCEGSFPSTSVCANGHFVCDVCHAEDGRR